ncbi:MAG: tRNA lysidine(34) synthetase TilS [Janthinobacterium lividum]
MENPAASLLAAWAPPLPFAVAYSGGADSTFLLRSAAALWPGQVHALHVHHGLQTSADAFVAHCGETCRAIDVPLHVEHVDARHAPGQSPEDAARRARYRTLAALAQARGLGHVALAQHADDQVETLLIALGRGAGVDGLAGMPRTMRRHGVVFHRPLLDLHVGALRAWLASQRFGFLEDPSNTDERYTRNRIRHRLLPELAEVLPRFRETFARSARNAARSSTLLADLATIDLATVGTPPRIAGLQTLTRERRANALRYWLRQAHEAVPSEAQLQQLLDQIDACRTRGHRIRLKVADGFVEREGELVRWYNFAPSP